LAASIFRKYRRWLGIGALAVILIVLSFPGSAKAKNDWAVTVYIGNRNQEPGRIGQIFGGAFL
jgi:hypothetical protein